MATKFLDYTGLDYLWSKIKEWCSSIFVTKATDENITGTKTFVGSKKIAFKQSVANDKLGFTLFNNSNKEQGYLEYNPTNKIAGVPLMTLGNYATTADELTYVGFRRYSNISGASGAYNLLTPLISDAKTPFNLTTTYTNFYLPLGISDGTNIVTAANSGVVDISSLLPAIPSLSRTISGSGNAITDITVSGHAITATKGATFLTSHQDISGKVNKSGDTMTGNLLLKVSETRGVAPSAYKSYYTSYVVDSNGEGLGGVVTEYWPDGRSQTRLMAFDTTAASGGSTASLGIACASNGSPYTFAPTPAATDNSTKIATTAFVKSQGYVTENDKVKQVLGSGNIKRPILTRWMDSDPSGFANYAVYNNDVTINTSTGTLGANRIHITNDVPGINFYTSNYIKGDTLSAETTSGIFVHDGGTPVTDQNRLWVLVNHISPNNDNVVRLVAYRAVANNNWWCAIELHYDADSKTYATCPTPDATTYNDTKIATTAWVRKATGNTALTAANVSGVVAVANGGTGSSTKNFVDLSTAQTVGGEKTFSSRITLHGPMSGRGIDWVANTLVKGTVPSSNQNMYFYFIDKNGYSTSQNNVFGAVGIAQYSNGEVAARLVGYSNNVSSNTYGVVVAGVDGNGIAFASATSTSSSRSASTDIITRDWIPRDTRIVHTTGDEAVSGVKTFNSDIYTGTLGRYTVAGNVVKRVDTDCLSLCGGRSNTVNNGSYILLNGNDEVNGHGIVFIRTGKANNSYGSLEMRPSGTFTWNGQNIQVSSDERIKTSLVSVPDEILDAWESVDWGQFQYLDAIASKGESARLHLGLIAQHAMSAFESRGLDACKYGIFCHETNTLAGDAEFSSEIEPTDLWMVRYTEALCMEAAYMRRENARLKKRVADLEERLAALELKVS